MEQPSQQFTINLKGLGLRVDDGLPKADFAYGTADWPVPSTAEAWHEFDQILPGSKIEVLDADGNELVGVIVDISSRLGEVVVFVVNDKTEPIQCRTLRAEFSPLTMNIPPTLH